MTMEIKLDNLQTDAFDVRDDSDEDNYEMLKGSLDKDGQWNPIIVRPGENGDYEVIAGHTRCRAARDLGWDTIEANVKDVGDEKADELSLKTNLVRSGMSKVEEGKVLNHMQRKYEITQRELADRLGKSSKWVSTRISVALDLHKNVQRMVDDGEITFTAAQVLSSEDKSDQEELAKIVAQRNNPNKTEVREIKSRYFNDTLYTIGYQGRDWDEFVSLLKDNDIDLLIDVRKSSKSQYKPAFSGETMRSRLDKEGITYWHQSQLGVDYQIREPYIEGYVDTSAFEGWYEWSVFDENEFDLDSFVEKVEGKGTPALMCMERHAKPESDQEIHCHRDLLAGHIAEVENDGEPRFPNRVDL